MADVISPADNLKRLATEYLSARLSGNLEIALEKLLAAQGLLAFVPDVAEMGGEIRQRQEFRDPERMQMAINELKLQIDRSKSRNGLRFTSMTYSRPAE